MEQSTWHDPVMVNEVVEALAIQPGGRYVDATLGDGGHAAAILERLDADGRLLGLDRDADALARASQRLAVWANTFVTVQTPFGALDAAVESVGWSAVDGVLFDLGVRSDQLDRAGRGFSFLREGPLDMRMDQSQGETAADLVNTWAEADLADLLWRYGGEKASRRIARRLVHRRSTTPFTTTRDLAAVVAEAVGGRRGRIDPATRTFMALRMQVNDELGEIERGLEAAVRRLRPGGRLAVLSYHSVEDRLVKRLLAAHEGRQVSLQAGGVEWQGEEPRVRRVSRKPVRPTDAEVQQNARARSAQLRVVERIAA